MKRRSIVSNRSLLIPAVLICLFCLPHLSFAQVSRSIYFQKQLPGANQLNPAFHPDVKFYVNAPYLSSFYLGFESPFSFEQLTGEWEAGDSLYIDRDRVFKSLKNRNYFSFELYNEFWRSGFSFGRHFFHLNIAKVFSAKFAFEKDLIGLLLYGNANERYFGKTLNLDRNGLNMTSYHEIGLGYSFEVNQKLTLGTRLKYLNGAFNVWTEKSNIILYTNEASNYPLTATSDFLIKTSSTISDFDNMIDQIEGYKWFNFTGNHGYGMDLGADFHPNEQLGFSASVVDLGWIRWKQNVNNFYSENPGVAYTFSGFDINDFIQEGSFNDTVDFLDTITDQFRLAKNSEPYTSHLSPKVYLGAVWSISDKNDLGLMIRTDFAEDRTQPSITVNYTRQIGKWASVYGNYSILASQIANIGLGFSVRFGPVQIYLLNDMAYALVIPTRARNYNFHYGINFLFGKKHDPTFKGIPKTSGSSDTD